MGKSWEGSNPEKKTPPSKGSPYHRPNAGGGAMCEGLQELRFKITFKDCFFEDPDLTDAGARRGGSNVFGNYPQRDG